MSWPLSQDYNEAIQDPRNSFRDAELKTGEAAANALGIPMPRSGNFADVYELRCPSGARWAVKCFTREIHGLRERYHEISKYLHQVNLPFMVDFQYLEQGIRVRGAWYPVLKMQWVEGFVLNEFVRDNLDKTPILQALGQIWLRMARRLRAANLAHCDLQHGNVLFVPGSSANSLAVKLIDYDGMCVPALAGVKSGEVGHPAYQHPERLRTGAYNQEVDRFSLLSIATGLRCLTVGGRSLWERYDNGDNLLFRQSDLQAPAQSPLFQELLAIRDPLAQTLVKELYRACQGPLDAVPHLTDLLPEEKPASRSRTATTTQPDAAQGPDWDFGDDDEIAEIVRKRKRAERKIPLWAWGALGGAAAVLLLAAGVGAVLALRGGPTKKDETPLALNKPDVKPPVPVPQPPPEANPQPQPAKGNGPGQGENNPANGAEPVRLAGDNRIFQLTPSGDALALLDDERDRNWKLIQPGTNKLIRAFNGHTGAITAIAFSADGKLALTAAEDRSFRVWDVQSGQTVQSCPLITQKVIRMALATDGQRLAWTDASRNVYLCNFENKPPKSPFHVYGHGQEATCAAFSPDGRYLFSGFDAEDATPREVVIRRGLKPGATDRTYSGGQGHVRGLAVSPDGRYFATVHGDENSSVELWEVESGRLVRQFSMPKSPIHQLAFSPDGHFLLATAANRYQIWPVEPAGNGGFAGRGGADTTQEFVTAAFMPDSKAVTLVFRKDDRASVAHTVRLPATAVAGNPSVRTVYLADLKEERVAGALAFAKRDGSKVNNRPSPNNVFLHPPDNGAGHAYFNLGKKYRRFQSTVGIRDGTNSGQGSGTPLTFRVLGDDRELWKSDPIQRCGDTRDCTVSVAGVERLELQVECPGTAFCAQAIWVEPRLEEDSPSPGTVVVKPAPRPVPRPGRLRRNRMTAPGENQLDDARKQIRVMYRDDYKDKSKRALAAQFYDGSLRQGDFAVRYALLTESRELAAQSGDFAAALRAVTRLCEQFADDPLELKCRAVEQSLPNIASKSDHRALTQKVLLLTDRALIDERYELAGRLLKVARAAAEKADMSAVLKKAVEHSAKQFDAQQTAYKTIKPAVEKLESNPEDEEASLALGKFRCLVRDDWEGGLPLLEHGSDASLRELARKDLAAPQDAASRASLGDAWFERAGKSTDKEKNAYLRRAFSWYQDAFAGLDRKGQAHVNQQLAKLKTQLPELFRSFADLDYSGPTIRGKASASVLHLGPHQVVATRRLYRGPIDIRVTAALSKGHIRISFLNGGEMTLDPDGTNFKVRVYYPFGSDADERGGVVSNGFGRAGQGPLQEIRMQVRPDGWSAFVNNQLTGGQGGPNIGLIDYMPAPVRVWSDDGEIDIKSIVVKPVR